MHESVVTQTMHYCYHNLTWITLIIIITAQRRHRSVRTENGVWRAKVQVVHCYREDLTAWRVPVLLPGVFPRYSELGLVAVHPAQSRDLTAVDLSNKPRSQTLSACTITLSHRWLVQRSAVHRSDRNRTENYAKLTTAPTHKKWLNKKWASKFCHYWIKHGPMFKILN